MTVEIPEEFFEKMERFTGSLSESDRRWFMRLLTEAPKARVTRSNAEKAVEELSKPIAERRGRPRKAKELPSRIKWAVMGKSGAEALDAAQDWLRDGPPSPPRMDWERYFLISTLASAWGSRLNKARGSPLAFSWGDADYPSGPFFEAVKLCLRQLGRTDTDFAIADAIITARTRIFAL